jgi:hypothetical protein
MAKAPIGAEDYEKRSTNTLGLRTQSVIVLSAHRSFGAEN